MTGSPPAGVPAASREAALELNLLLRELDPVLQDGSFVFCTTVGPVPEGIPALATVVEAEGVSYLVSTTEADAAQLDESAPLAWITLRVRSSLSAVGLTAAVATALTGEGISCNVIAGYHHDHLLVPEPRAQDALRCLAALSGRSAETQKA